MPGRARSSAWRADGDDAAFFHDEDAIGIDDGGEAMGDDDGGAVVHELLGGVLDELFGLGIEGGGGLVEDEDAGILEEDAGDGDALALAAGKGDAALADVGFVAVAEPGDEVVGIGGPGGGDDFILGGAGPAVADVLGDGAGEEDVVLHDDSDLAADGLDVVGGDGFVVDEDFAGGGIVEAGEEGDDGAFAGAAGADEGDHFAGLDGEVDVVEGGLADAVAEGDVAELDLALDGGEFGEGVVVGDVGFGVEDGEDFLHGGDTGLDDGVGGDDVDDGRVEHREVAEEGEEVAGGEAGSVPADEPGAEADGEELAEAGEKFGKGEEEGVAPDDAVVVDVVGLDAGAEGVFLDAFGGEGADDAVVGDAFVEEAEDAGPVAAMGAAFHAHAAAVPAVVDDEEGSEDDGDEGEFPVEDEEPDEDAGGGDEVAEEGDGGAGDERVDGGGVVDDAADDAAGLAFLVKFEGEFLEMGEDGDAEVAGDLHAVFLDEVIAGHLRDGPDDEDEAVGDEEGVDGGPAVGLGGVVDDFADDAGKAEGAEGDDDDEGEDAGELELVGLEVGAGADKCPEDFVAGAFTRHRWKVILANPAQMSCGWQRGHLQRAYGQGEMG